MNLIHLCVGNVFQWLTRLTRLDLQGNQLQSLPAEILGLSALSTLNVSRNCVGPVLTFDPAVCCSTLRQLNLSFNHITTFPSELGCVMERLEECFLEGWVDCWEMESSWAVDVT